MTLIIAMLERLGVFAILFILLLRYKGFQRLISGSASRREKIVLCFLFGFAGIAATYGGLPFHGAIANLRGVAVALAGILGGPIVGLFAGGIAGGHRFLMDADGFTALSCGLATVAQGFLTRIEDMLTRPKLYLASLEPGAVRRALGEERALEPDKPE